MVWLRRHGPVLGVLALAAALALAGLLCRSGRGVPEVPGGEAGAGPAVTVQPAGAGELSAVFAAVADAVMPAVVRIQAERSGAGGAARVPLRLRDLFRPPPEEEGAEPEAVMGGTGFVVAPDGYIVTNNHVVADAERIRVTLFDKRDFEAVVVGRDQTTDVAVLKIPAAGLAAVRLGDSDAARVGEWVLAIGNPGFDVRGAEEAGTLDFTVTSGIISAKGRPLSLLNRELAREGEDVASYAIEDFLQTDAVINPGNSGGPLVNLRGEVIGMNTAIASLTGFYQGYGFAIPANLVRRVVRDLIEHGHVRRPLLGVTIADVTAEDAEVYRLPAISGVLLEDFAAGSPARAAGLERGDVIVAVDGEPVERVGQLQRLVAERQPGDVVRVTVVRYGVRREFRVRLAQAPIPVARPPARVARPTSSGGDRLGIEVAELDAELARRLGYPRAGGVVVAAVHPSSPAARKGVVEGARILAVGRVRIVSAAQARALFRSARPGSVLSLLLEQPDGRKDIANIRVP